LQTGRQEVREEQEISQKRQELGMKVRNTERKAGNLTDITLGRSAHKKPVIKCRKPSRQVRQETRQR
jgi:hypothetical protein